MINKEQAKSKEVHITHVFNAERELVFKAWTDPEQLAKWYAPDGCTISFAKADIKQGGQYLSCVHVPTYGDCWCKGTYQVVDAPNKLVFTMEVTDETGKDVTPAEAGMAEGWPQVTTVTVTFFDMDGKTKIELHQTVSEELAKKTGAYPSWISMFDKLVPSINS
ncbi:MAG TPA: SRPBCC domain-containing protein [Chitinophagales bacterium]|nr:SRPBCC domain-containing protein [Chitinophagales bacterium]